MGVLRNVTGTWRLFWVLEVIGLSFLLALLSIKITGSAESVDKDDSYSSVCGWAGCSIYTWWFILWLHPIAVTACALVATSAVSAPMSSLAGRWLQPVCRPGWVAVKCLLLCAWACMGWFLQYTLDLRTYPYVHSVLAVLVVLLAFGCRKHLKAQFIDGRHRFHETVDPRPRKYLSWLGLAVGVVSVIATVGVIRSLSAGTNEWLVYFFFDWFSFLPAIVDLNIDMWLILGILSTGVRPVADSLPVQQVTWMLLGWWATFTLNSMLYWVFGLATTADYSRMTLIISPPVYFLGLAYRLALGTLLWGERAGTYGVAFWGAASLIRINVINCLVNWIFAWAVGVVK